MNRIISNLRFQIAVFALIASPAFGGLRIDLRPTPPVPPGGYQPGTDVHVNVFLVDTGNPQGQIAFRGVFLDFSDSPPWSGGPGTLTYLDPDGAGSLPPGSFTWICPFSMCGFNHLPQTSWVYPLSTPNPLFQIVMPNNGEVQIGGLIVDVGTEGGILDATNRDNPDPFFGARVDFGFGGAGDPITTWRAFTGEITGGTLELPVIPEPTSLVLITCAAGFLGLWRKESSAQSRQAAKGEEC